MRVFPDAPLRKTPDAWAAFLRPSGAARLRRQTDAEVAMKPVLFLAAALAILATVPASAQTGGGPPASSGTPSNFLSLGDLPYTSVPGVGPERRPGPNRCFNGRRVAGANRAGDKTLYVQGQHGAIFR